LRLSGLHRQPGRGIDASSEGAAAVVFSGVYADDVWNGNEAWYTGEGGQDRRGRQVRDQELTRGNLALKRSLDENRPVRVIRRVDRGDDYEYIYEGLYEVCDLRFEPSKAGPKIYRFLLRTQKQ
jgi:hypothetical protein